MNRKWDSWAIFGGDGEDGLPVRQGCENDLRLIWSAESPSGGKRHRSYLRCDGGPRGLLDFDIDRRPEQARAEADWDWWEALISGLPRAAPLTHFMSQYHQDPSVYTWHDAQDEYSAQAIIVRYREAAGFDRAVPIYESDDPIVKFGYDRSGYVRRRVARVIPTSALLTLDHRWIDEESFQHSYDESHVDQYYQFADDYLTKLDAAITLVRVWFHC